jgi:hypothetical protein
MADPSVTPAAEREKVTQHARSRQCRNARTHREKSSIVHSLFAIFKLTQREIFCRPLFHLANRDREQKIRELHHRLLLLHKYRAAIVLKVKLV